MATLIDSLFCAGIALLIYGTLGLPLAVRLAKRSPVVVIAPLLGWAVHSALTLPLFSIIGFSRVTVLAGFAVPLAIAALSLWRGRRAIPITAQPVPPLIIALTLIGAAAIAFVVMAVDLPKYAAQGVTLAGPIFDHSKVAMIDEMTRLGVPPGNPFIGGEGAPSRLSYYYLWHFSAAALSLLTGVSGWEADAGMSWFTGFTTIIALAGLATWLSGRASAALWIVALAVTGSVRPLLSLVFDPERVEELTGYPSGFGGFLFQISWAPQHTASALCAVVALIVLVDLMTKPRWPSVALFGVLMAAGFQSSTWVGGVVFPLMAAPVMLYLLACAAPSLRMRLVVRLAGAALIALLLIAPFLYDQATMAAMRGDGPPIAIMPVDVLGESIVTVIGDIWNWPAYWLIYLPVELPAIFITGLLSLAWLLRDRAPSPDRRLIVIAFALGLAVSLVAAWLLVSTLGDNNDLGWRAVLPAVLLLMVFAAAGLSRLTWSTRPALLTGAVALLLLGLPDGLRFGYGSLVVTPNASSASFAGSEALWAAVRRLTPPAERVGNNPNYMSEATGWPVNISWALMANRRSCFAGPALVGPFSALSRERQAEVDAQFMRVFAGAAQPGDVEQMATAYQCSTVVIAPSDGAWGNDPFAASPLYRIAETAPGWRIYRRAP